MIHTPAAMDVPLRTDEHGKIRIGSSRVLLELVIYAFQQGETAESIVDSYPTLKLSDVYAVLAFFLTHRADVDAYMQEADEAAEQIRREVEAKYSPEALALHARLRAVRDKQQRAE
jgi:uncharacterized protein (DUF433 family)